MYFNPLALAVQAWTNDHQWIGTIDGSSQHSISSILPVPSCLLAFVYFVNCTCRAFKGQGYFCIVYSCLYTDDGAQTGSETFEFRTIVL